MPLLRPGHQAFPSETILLHRTALCGTALDHATWNAERVFDIKVSEQLGNTIARAAFSFNIGEQDLTALISVNYGRRRLGAAGERAAARSLAWLHKYVEVTHPDGSVLRATMGKNCLDGWTTTWEC